MTIVVQNRAEADPKAECDACLQFRVAWAATNVEDLTPLEDSEQMLAETHHAELAALRAENVRLREYVRNAGDTFAGLTGEHGVAGLTYFREKKVWLGRMLDEASRALKGDEA